MWTITIFFLQHLTHPHQKKKKKMEGEFDQYFYLYQ